ncbi:hypothetical protein EI94DRAFT_1699850 [Lactarius quietus]|nr:hypothetical protein EI94DRAFT_1699850 [Lactarius quietus]
MCSGGGGARTVRLRQPPAMTRYHGNLPKQRNPPQEKRWHPKSWRKHKFPPTLADSEVPLPQANVDDDLPSFTNPGDTHWTNPKVPATRSRSEPRAQLEAKGPTGKTDLSMADEKQ